MKKIIYILSISLFAIGCDQSNQNEGEIVLEEQIEPIKPSLEERAEKLKQEGHNVFLYEEGDTIFLMQEYYMVFLKKGKNRSQDSTQAAELQKQHLAHLTRMAEQGYASLIGPFGDDGEIRGIVVYNTKNKKMADSLANLDPMVRAGRLEVEVHPWWTAKGGKLQ